MWQGATLPGCRFNPFGRRLLPRASILNVCCASWPGNGVHRDDVGRVEYSRHGRCVKSDVGNDDVAVAFQFNGRENTIQFEVQRAGVIKGKRIPGGVPASHASFAAPKVVMKMERGIQQISQTFGLHSFDRMLCCTGHRF